MKKMFRFYFTNLLSIAFGKLADCAFPYPLQKLINTFYVRIFSIDMSEFDTVASFRTLNRLFTRELLHKRTFDVYEKILISPADSRIYEIEKIDGDSKVLVKGAVHDVRDILGVEKLEENLTLLNFYLSPKDYHRYHAPCDMQVERMRYYPGALYPVNDFGVKYIENLYGKNERVVLDCVTKCGKRLYFVAVGALNVGKIVFHFDTNIATNRCKNSSESREYHDLHLKKGDEMGYFKMGSTILLFVENIDEVVVQRDEKVRFSESVAMLH